MAARPQEAPPFSVPCSRRHFTLITMRLAPSSLPQPLESLTPSLGLPSLPFNPSHPGISSLYQSHPSPFFLPRHLHTIDSANAIHARWSSYLNVAVRPAKGKNSLAARIGDWSMSVCRVYWTVRWMVSLQSLLFDDMNVWAWAPCQTLLSCSLSSKESRRVKCKKLQTANCNSFKKIL